MKRQLVSVIGVDIIDIDLFYHFINYYDPYIDEFSIIFNYKDKNLLDAFYELVPKNKKNIHFWDEPYSEHKKNQYTNTLINSYNKSTIIADHDEFIEFTPNFFECPVNQYNRGVLVERFNIIDDKIALSKVDKNKNLFEQFPYILDDQSYIKKWRSVNKVCYVHNNMDVFLGHHYVLDKKFKSFMTTNVYHFKYDSFFQTVVNNVFDLKLGFKHEISHICQFINDPNKQCKFIDTTKDLK